jgi:hypothetical protein
MILRWTDCCGITEKRPHHFALDAVYPIDAKDAIPPSHSCGVEPYQPQRMISNEMAAMLISTIVNELFSSNSILVHYVNFNAMTGNCRPVYADDVVLAESTPSSDVSPDEEQASGINDNEDGGLGKDPSESDENVPADEDPAPEDTATAETQSSAQNGVHEKVFKVIRIEPLNEKHEKTKHGYGIPVLYHLDNGSTLRRLITGTRLKDAKARVERLSRDPGNRWIEFTDNGLLIERSSIGLVG